MADGYPPVFLCCLCIAGNLMYNDSNIQRRRLTYEQKRNFRIDKGHLGRALQQVFKRIGSVPKDCTVSY
jgi:hypothetical protein